MGQAVKGAELDDVPLSDGARVVSGCEQDSEGTHWILPRLSIGAGWHYPHSSVPASDFHP